VAYIGDEIAHHSAPVSLLRKGAAHVEAAPFQTDQSLSERVVQDVQHLKTQLATLPPGPKRDHIAKQIRQIETAVNIDQWLKSPGLQPPQDIGKLGKVNARL
jgi:hypothetical protein